MSLIETPKCSAAGSVTKPIVVTNPAMIKVARSGMNMSRVWLRVIFIYAVLNFTIIWLNRGLTKQPNVK